MALSSFSGTIIQITSYHGNFPVVTAIMSIAVLLFGLGIAWGNLKSNVNNIKNEITHIKPYALEVPSIKIEISALGNKFDQLNNKFDELNKKFDNLTEKLNRLIEKRVMVSNSPKALNQFGKTVLENTNIQKIILRFYNEIILEMRSKSPKNAYRAEELLFEIVIKLPEKHPDITDEVENSAYLLGIDLDNYLKVGAISIRKKAFKDIGIHIDEININ